jgi:regulator of protease activity HflC (stomatin/prohibitin superfamily)
MSLQDEAADLLPGAPLSRAAQLVRRLVVLYAIFAGAVVLMLLIGLAPLKAGEKLKDLGVESLIGGLGATALAGVLLSLTALVAAALLTDSRLWTRRREAALAAGEMDPNPPTLLTPLWRLGPGVLARIGQAVLLPLGLVVMALIARLLWPSVGAAAPVSGAPNLDAAGVVGLAFASLIAERMMYAFPAGQMPEAPGLRRLLLLTTLMLGVAGVAEVGRGVGFAWVVWIQRALIIGAIIIAGELALRALARLFLPAPSADTAKAATDSIFAALITGGPRAPAALIRTHLGLDFARSWALAYIRAAAFPAIAGTLLLCWLLSGVKLLDGDQRGIYERLGAPVAVIGPGLHILAPWPLGRLRPVEYGTIHSIAIGADQTTEASDQIGADDTPQSGMNRLWDTSHATEAEYLVGSQTEGLQGFQVVDAEIRVLYRTGLTDAAAWQSVYGSSDQVAVVKQEASRLATRYFSSHTLDEVMGGQRESLEESLRAQLAQAVAADHAGIDIVAVLIEAVHPPAGAAAAYHAVQAAEINADASVANATGHALRTAGEAQAEAQQLADSAQANAVEKVQAATGDAYQFNADRKAYHASPSAFLLERRDTDLTQALKGQHLIVVDSRLTSAQMPLIDMRAPMTPAPANGVSTGAPTHEMSEGFAPDQLPSTSTEGPAPPSTNEEANERSPATRPPGAQ